MSKLFKLFVEVMQGSKDRYKSVEKWKRPGRIADLRVRILSEMARTSIMYISKKKVEHSMR